MNKFRKGDKVLVVNKDYLKGEVVSYDFQSKSYDILCEKNIINTLEINLRSSIFLFDSSEKQIKKQRQIDLKAFNMRKNIKRYMYKKSIIVGGDKNDRNDVIKDILYYTRSIPRVVVFTDDEVSKSFFQQYMPSTVILDINIKKIENLVLKNKRGINQKHCTGLTIVLDNVDPNQYTVQKLFYSGLYENLNVIISCDHANNIPKNSDVGRNADTHYIITNSEKNTFDNPRYLRNYIGHLDYCSKSDVYKRELYPKVQEINDTDAEFYRGIYESDISLNMGEIRNITNKYKCIVIDGYHVFFVDTCFWYEAKPGRKFRVGSRELWKEYDNAVIIQCFFRISYSKKKAYELRSIPDNLFDPEFSSMRKKLLDIDDSCFK